MKLFKHIIDDSPQVTPCVGVWIETDMITKVNNTISVTPCVGVWIETLRRDSHCWWRNVTPCVGVWIETCTPLFAKYSLSGHTLRGCVD